MIRLTLLLAGVYQTHTPAPLGACCADPLGYMHPVSVHYGTRILWPTRPLRAGGLKAQVSSSFGGAAGMRES